MSVKYLLLTCGFSRAEIPAPTGGAVERGMLGDGMLWEEEGRLGSPQLSIIAGLTLKDRHHGTKTSHKYNKKLPENCFRLMAVSMQ